MHASFSVSAICLGPRAFPSEREKALGTRLRTNSDECLYGRRVAWSLVPGPCTATHLRGTRDPVPWNNEACLMRYSVEYKSKLAQLENLSGLFRWTPPITAFLSIFNFFW